MKYVLGFVVYVLMVSVGFRFIGEGYIIATSYEAMEWNWILGIIGMVAGAYLIQYGKYFSKMIEGK